MKHFSIYLGLLLLVSSCSFWEEEKVEPLLSKIDGQEYFSVINGEMNTAKACLYILKGKEDSVEFHFKLDLLDSLESNDSLWRDKYFKATNKVLKDIYESNSAVVEGAVFSYFLHYPKEFLTHMNNDAFENVDLWMEIMKKALQDATSPKDITSNSVINAALKNCTSCNKEDEKLIVTFVRSLEKL